MIRVFKSTVMIKSLTDEELTQLVDDFKQYKMTDIPPEYFGRDVPYDHPNSLPSVLAEELQHLHLGSEDEPLPLRNIQFHRTSDVHLVYCQGAMNSDCYLLMAILKPNAHDLANNREVMFKLATMAEKFRSRF
jgi:mRNA interferase YafO